MVSMRQIRIEKITFNVGAGKDQAVLEKGMKLLKMFTGIESIKTITKKRIPSWGIRPGLPVGCKITIRDKDKIKDLLARCLKARDSKLPMSCFDDYGNISFGIREYIDIPGLEYNPEIEIMGFELSLTLERPGFSVERKQGKKSIGNKHKIQRDEAIKFMKDDYGIQIEELK